MNNRERTLIGVHDAQALVSFILLYDTTLIVEPPKTSASDTMVKHLISDRILAVVALLNWLILWIFLNSLTAVTLECWLFGMF